MAKLVTKWRYLKPDAARHAQAYIRYIATREGVEKYVEENGARPAAQAQRVLVEKLLRDFPDARRSFEYEDYARRPTVRNASEFITRTLEEHLELFDARSNYVSYIAQRPRVQRSGAHGLFTQEEDAPDLNAAARAVSEHDGNIWTYSAWWELCKTVLSTYWDSLPEQAPPLHTQCGGDRRAVQCAGRVVSLVRSLPQRSAPSPCTSGLLCGPCAKAGAHKGGGGAAPLPPRTADIPG